MHKSSCAISSLTSRCVAVQVCLLVCCSLAMAWYELLRPLHLLRAQPAACTCCRPVFLIAARGDAVVLWEMGQTEVCL
jgi:hypothetical protein